MRESVIAGFGMSESERQHSHSPVEGQWPVVVRPLLSSKRRPHFKIRKVWKEQKCGHGARNQEWLCWRGSIAIYWLCRLFGPWLPFQFLNLYTVGRTLWTEHQPVARPLPTHRTQAEYTHTDIHASSGIRTHYPSVRAKTVHTLDRTATVIGY
jgi:hypothetical protein